MNKLHPHGEENVRIRWLQAVEGVGGRAGTGKSAQPTL